MNALEMARTAYASPAAPIRTERGTEFDAISRITGQLRSAIPNRKKNFKAFVTALHQNARLWTVIAANVADDKNELPADLRARLFYLAEFTQAQTRLALSGKEDAGVLVEINVAIMHGLRGQPAQPDTTQKQDPS